jgi:hypothetical protein
LIIFYLLAKIVTKMDLWGARNIINVGKTVDVIEFYPTRLQNVKLENMSCRLEWLKMVVHEPCKCHPP